MISDLLMTTLREKSIEYWMRLENSKHLHRDNKLGLYLFGNSCRMRVMFYYLDEFENEKYPYRGFITRASDPIPLIQTVEMSEIPNLMAAKRMIGL